MSILITGSEGFIGKKLVERIRSNTPHDVITYDIRSDVNRSKLYDQYDIIYHLGAISDTREKDKEKIYKYNIEVTKILIDVNKSYVENPAFISFASSASVYGSSNEELYVGHPLNPQSYYAKSKYACELLLDLSGLDHNNLRLFNVYSTDGSESHKVGHASPHHTFMNQNPIKIFEGSDKVLRDFIHVDEVVEAFIKLTMRNGTFNIGSGVAQSFQEIAEKISEQTGAPIEKIPFPKERLNDYQWYTKASKSVRETIYE